MASTNCAAPQTLCTAGTGLDANILCGFSSRGELFLLTSFFIEPKGCGFEMEVLPEEPELAIGLSSHSLTAKDLQKDLQASATKTEYFLCASHPINCFMAAAPPFGSLTARVPSMSSVTAA